VAEFEAPGELVTAARRAREEGYRRMDAYSPFPIHELTAALGLRRTRLPLLVFAGGLVGAGVALLMQWFSAVLGMLRRNGLPMPYHPIFNAPRFALASRDRFFFCIEARDPKFDPERTSRFLANLGARVVSEVEE